VENCEAVGGRIALLDLPPRLRASDIVNWRRALASDRAALFAPWLRAAAVDDPLGAPVSLPPSAAAAGLIARVEQQIGVFASPGNQTIAGVFALAEDPGLPEPGFLHEERIDVVRATEKGIQLMGSRTTSLDPDGTHISVRRVIDWLKAQLALDLAWAPFEPNDPTLWSAMVRAAEQRLRALFDAGGLAGNTEQEAYFVRCDASTNVQPDLDAGRAIMLVGVAPAVPAEFLVFRLVREGGSEGSIVVTP
jgi:phage tail sheath protein FI